MLQDMGLSSYTRSLGLAEGAVKLSIDIPMAAALCPSGRICTRRGSALLNTRVSASKLVERAFLQTAVGRDFLSTKMIQNRSVL